MKNKVYAKPMLREFGDVTKLTQRRRRRFDWNGGGGYSGNTWNTGGGGYSSWSGWSS